MNGVTCPVQLRRVSFASVHYIEFLKQTKLSVNYDRNKKLDGNKTCVQNGKVALFPLAGKHREWNMFLRPRPMLSISVILQAARAPKGMEKSSSQV